MMRFVLAAFSVACLGLTCAPLRAEDPDATVHGPYATALLVDGVRLMAPPPDYRGFATSNIVLIEQSDGIVVVDTGVTRADGVRVGDYVASFTTKPVTAIILTHWHNDHPQGASAITQRWPAARVIATAATRKGIAGPAQVEGVGFAPNPAWETKLVAQLRQTIETVRERANDASRDAAGRARYLRMERDLVARLADLPGTVLTAPTEILDDEILLDDPLRPVAVRFLGRANTPGDAVVWLPNEKLVATGDIVVAPTPFGFYSFPSDWIETLEKVKALDFEVLVPGHGLPQQTSAYIDRLVAAIEDIRAQVGPLAAQGLGIEEVRDRVDFAEQTAIFGTSARRKTEFESYWLRPMVDNAWREANGLPIVQGAGETP